MIQDRPHDTNNAAVVNNIKRSTMKLYFICVTNHIYMYETAL